MMGRSVNKDNTLKSDQMQGSQMNATASRWKTLSKDPQSDDPLPQRPVSAAKGNVSDYDSVKPIGSAVYGDTPIEYEAEPVWINKLKTLKEVAIE